MTIKLVVGERASGRTKKMIEWAAESPDDRMLLLPNRQEHDRIKDLILPGQKLQTGVFAEQLAYASTRFVGPDMEFGIDNLDMCIQSMFRSHVAIASWEDWFPFRRVR